VAEAEEKSFEVILAGFFDLRTFDEDVIED
jgi:hypothetical protein